MELISVIVPVYNVEKYLKQCVNSLISQTYTNIEILLIDDGSKDSSGTLCDRLAEKDARIKVFHKENEGLGLTRNYGLERMNGQYVTFIDSDDYAEPDMIEKLYNGLIENKVDVCKCGFKRVDDSKTVLALLTYKDEIFPDSDAAKVYLARILGSAPEKSDSIEMCVCGVLFSTPHIREHQIKFPSERVLISEDLIFDIEYMQYAQGACTISYNGYNYRVNPVSLSKGYRVDRFDATCIFYKYVRNRLEQLGYSRDVMLRLSRLHFVYFRMCVKQECANRQLTFKEALRNIRRICSSGLVQTLIREYPVNLLGTSQMVFLLLLKHKMAFMLYILGRINLF